MDIRRVAAIALSFHDYESFEAKLVEACRWVSLAAKMGADLAVLPEALNKWQGDGEGNPKAMTMPEYALDDWQTQCQTLIDCAREHAIAVTVPIVVREADGLRNVSYLISRTGAVLGRYEKLYPTSGELRQGVVPGRFEPIPWEGLQIGGAICFDMNFPDVFTRQHEAGVDLFLCPSLFPGGDQLNYYAASLQCPIVLAYPAWSRIIGILGRELAAGGYRHETLRFGFGVPIYLADLNFDAAVFHFDGNQQKIEAIWRRHGQDVAIAFDQENVRYSLESRSDAFTVADLMQEFDLQPLRAYLDESARAVADARAR